MRVHRPDIVILGAGLMGQWHAAAARRLGARIVGVVDVDSERGHKLARTAGSHYFHDLDSLLAACQPQIAHICSPLQTHLDYAKRMLSAGSHVICEKPLAAKLDEVQSLLVHAQNTSRSVAPVHQFAFQPGVSRALEAMPRLGELRRIAFEISSAGAERANLATRDSMILDIVPHPLSVLKRLLPATPLVDLEWQVQHPRPGEVFVQTTLSGIAITIALSLSTRPTAAGALLAGTAGSIGLDFFHGHAVEYPGSVSRYRKIASPFTASSAEFSAAIANLAARTLRWEPAYPGLRNLIQTFYANPTAAGTAQQVAATLDIYAACTALAARL